MSTDDPVASAEKVRTVIFVCGKHYYALEAERAAGQRSDVAIVRLEQLTPFPTLQLNEIRDKYKNATSEYRPGAEGEGRCGQS